MARKKNRVLLYIILMFLMLAVTVFGGQVTLFAFAATDSYTNVLTDLGKVDDFNAADYPDNVKDYSIQIIQIAESTDGELFIYTYQPCQKSRYLVATSINMSLSESVDRTDLFAITLININGVFGKYKVNGLKVSDSATRYYNITSIYRPVYKDIDGTLGGNQTLNEKAYAVGQIWKVTGKGDNVSYSYVKSRVVEIKPEQKYCGKIRYVNGWLPFGYVEKCDSHYVAFDCDYKIDELYEANVFYVEQKYILKQSLLENLVPVGEPVSDTVYLKGEDKGGNTVNGLFADKYEWTRIERAETFINDPKNGLSEEVKNILKDKQWVLRYKETTYSQYTEMGASITEYSQISEVSILRLKFKSNGIVYNLGVVDSKQTGPNNPDNIGNIIGGMPWWVLLLIVVGVVITICLIISLIKFGIKVVFSSIFSALWFIICLPFRGIASLVRKIRGE